MFDNSELTTQFNGQPVNLSLWDTAGPEDYDRLRPLSYPCTHIFLVTFSLINPASFSNVTAKWLPEVRHHCPNTPVVLIGTKYDLTTDRDMLRNLQQKGYSGPISFEEGEKCARENGCLTFIETSALTGENVSDLPQIIAKLCVVAAESKIVKKKKTKKECMLQ